MRRATVVLLLAGGLIGCATPPASESPWLVQRDGNTPRSCDPLSADHELVLGLSRELAGEGRRHAALANLERLPGDVPQVRLNKARLLRVLGHTQQAEILYRSLLGSCLEADANHGLGQIEASRGHYPQAQDYLRSAASLAPANEAIRNDLGVVYLNQRRLTEAQFELLTAMELGDDSRRAAMNMLTLLVYQGNLQAARELLASRGLSSADFQQAERRARSMHAQDAPAPATPQTPRAEPAVAASTRPSQAAVAQPAPQAAEVASARMSLSAAARAWAGEEPAASAAGDTARSATGAARRPLVCRSSGAGSLRQAVMECLPE